MVAYRENDYHDIRSEMWRTNRVKKTEPRQKLGWCDRCDRNLIGVGQRCSVCGFRNTKSKHQKP